MLNQPLKSALSETLLGARIALRNSVIPPLAQLSVVGDSGGSVSRSLTKRQLSRHFLCLNFGFAVQTSGFTQLSYSINSDLYLSSHFFDTRYSNNHLKIFYRKYMDYCKIYTKIE